MGRGGAGGFKSPPSEFGRSVNLRVRAVSGSNVFPRKSPKSEIILTFKALTLLFVAICN